MLVENLGGRIIANLKLEVTPYMRDHISLLAAKASTQWVNPGHWACPAHCLPARPESSARRQGLCDAPRGVQGSPCAAL